MIVHDGRYRHSAYFSIIDSEWPEVKAKLEGMIHEKHITKTAVDLDRVQAQEGA